MNCRIFALRSSTEVQEPRLSSLRTSILNQISIWFSHEQWFGV